MLEEYNQDSAQYLSFYLAGKLFAFDVLKTREVLQYTNITPIPCTPPYVVGVLNLRGNVVTVMDLRVKFGGVLNLRGNVVTVMDLRVKFGLGDVSITDDTAIIIVEVNYEDEITVVGALVDGVKGVMRFEKDQIEPPPKIGMKLSADLINGIGKLDGNFVVMLNVDRVFSEEDLSFAKETLISHGEVFLDSASETVA